MPPSRGDSAKQLPGRTCGSSKPKQRSNRATCYTLLVHSPASLGDQHHPRPSCGVRRRHSHLNPFRETVIAKSIQSFEGLPESRSEDLPLFKPLAFHIDLASLLSLPLEPAKHLLSAWRRLSISQVPGQPTRAPISTVRWRSKS
jgi:hypothetical protein